nr:MAG TPA: hypothetical protein [Caudoviricetes sp.]
MTIYEKLCYLNINSFGGGAVNPSNVVTPPQISNLKAPG